MVLLDTILAKILDKSADVVYEQVLRRKRVSETARSFATGIKLVDANGLLLSIQALVPGSDMQTTMMSFFREGLTESFDTDSLSEEEVSSIERSTLRRMGVDGGIAKFEQEQNIEVARRFLETVDDQYFPEDIYKENLDKIGKLDSNQAEAVSEFYQTLRGLRQSLENVEEMINSDEDIPFSRLDHGLKRVASIAEELAGQKQEALKALGTKKEEIDEPLTRDQLRKADSN